LELQALKQRFGIIGNSDVYNRALERAVQVASTDLTVLITGESGVGKEVFSKVIHQLSHRKHNNFIAINCGAIPEGTIDSELFGHEKGAFTGASDKRTGYFEFANTGTIFLDEIGEMPLGTQARLLRVLESGEYIKVGSSKIQKTDVRVVAATNANVTKAIKNGKFREDLYYRLNTVPIFVPPLRERKEDIYLLFRKFGTDLSEKHKSNLISLTEEAKELLKSYYWPGNIRELKNISEQIAVLALDRIVDVEELKQYLPSNKRENTTLPMLANNSERDSDNMGMSEREVMYKLLFDMRKDLTELKQFMLQMAQSGALSNDDIARSGIFNEVFPQQSFTGSGHRYDVTDETRSNVPIVLSTRPTSNNFVSTDESAEIVEESLSIADKEKELIQVALKKHKGNRKRAASDLGISERTLYRKIKEYQIIE